MAGRFAGGRSSEMAGRFAGGRSSAMAGRFAGGRSSEMAGRFATERTPERRPGVVAVGRKAFVAENSERKDYFQRPMRR